MIAVLRLPEPVSLRDNAEQWTRELIGLLQAGDEGTDESLQQSVRSVRQRYKQKDVQEALHQMFAGKCAYCESRIGAVSYPDIEHFYPKSRYPEKTFLWTNLLHACEKCNRTYKRDQFPLDDYGEPLLIDPTAVDMRIEQHLEFIWDQQTQISLVRGLDIKGQTTIALLGLNKRHELLDERSDVMKRIIVIALYAQRGDMEAQKLLAELEQPRQPYLAYIRHYLATLE